MNSDHCHDCNLDDDCKKAAANASAASTFDLREIIQRIGDEEIARSVLADFLEEGASMIGNLRRAVAANDPDLIRLTAHSLKGAALTIGAAKLAEAAFAIETTAKNREQQKVASAMQAVVQRYEELTPTLRRAVECGVSVQCQD